MGHIAAREKWNATSILLAILLYLSGGSDFAFTCASFPCNPNPEVPENDITLLEVSIGTLLSYQFVVSTF